MSELDYTSLIDIIEDGVKKEWIDQGHNMNGFVNDLKTEVKEGNNFDELIGITTKGYVKYINAGVKRNKIPYTIGKGRGGTSKYIEGLIRYFKRKGVADAKSAAFATATKHKREGLSTVLSRRFSRTGRRQLFIEEAFKKTDSKIKKELTKIGAEFITDTMTNIIKVNT